MVSQVLLPLVGEKYNLDNTSRIDPETGKSYMERAEFTVLSIIPRSRWTIYVVGIWEEDIKPVIITLDQFNHSHPLIVG